MWPEDGVLPRVLLGSASRTRQQVLSEMGIDFKVLSVDIDEKAIGDRKRISPRELVTRLAKAKMEAVLERAAKQSETGFDVVLTCDQVVTFRREILEKPTSETEARTFLASYGRDDATVHTVGAFMLLDSSYGCPIHEVDITTMSFSPLPLDVIDDLIQQGDCLRSAGALIVEHPRMSPFVNITSGTIDGVMGLSKEHLWDTIGLLRRHVQSARYGKRV